jgi:putative endonuclease
LKSHNAGQVSSTERYRPYTLIYCEVYKNKYDAYKREKFLKTGWGRNYLKRVLRNYFLSKKLGG